MTEGFTLNLHDQPERWLRMQNAAARRVIRRHQAYTRAVSTGNLEIATRYLYLAAQARRLYAALKDGNLYHGY